MTGARVSLTAVRRTYPASADRPLHALDGITLQIPVSGFVSVVGPSGSGKSTLLHMIGAMDRPDEGTITVDDVNITDLDEKGRARYRRGIGFVFQRYHLIPALTALDNVMTPVLPYRTNFDKVQRARELLDAVGLGDRERSLPAHLSGGQQQRVAVARALINSPALLLADEPTGNLDSAAGDDVMKLLQHIRDEFGLTLVVATHDPLVASRTDRVISLHDGRVVNDVKPAPSTDDRDLLQEISRLDPHG